MTRTLATCHTADCVNVDVTLDVTDLVTYVDETGAAVTVDGVMCGPCGQQVTDITIGEDAPA